MSWNINKLNILLILNITLLSVHCQNLESFHTYDLVKSIVKSAEDISLSKSLKQLSEEDNNLLRAFQDRLPKSIDPILDELLPEVASDKCHQDLKYVRSNLSPPAEWAMRMVDSYGKPESGIMLGNVRWLGSYDQCLESYAPPEGNTSLGDFHGKYCTVQFLLPLGNMSLPISTAVCLPDSCSPNKTFNDMSKNISTDFNSDDMNERMESILSNATITCQAKSKELTAGFIAVVSLLSIIALLAVIGSSITALEYYLKTKGTDESLNLGDKSSLNGFVENASPGDYIRFSANNEVALPAWLERCKPFFNCFCIFTNGEKILNTAGQEGHLPCLHGIRFLSIAWVILCHCYELIQNYGKNLLDSRGTLDSWTFQVILNGFFSVDSFFALSGFLVGYLYFQQAHKTDGKIPWLFYYIHRYIRLTPVYMLVLAFYMTVSPYLGSGPLWPEYNVIQPCKDSWWWNMLYINNFHDKSDACMPWSWYLANDMQFYIISPLFLITLYKWPKIGYSIVGLFFCITFTTNFALTYEYELIAGLGNVLDNLKDLQAFLPKIRDFYKYVYIKPYTRIGSYLVGLLVACIVYERKQNNSGRLNKITLGIGWMLASGIALTCQFGLYHQKLSLVAASFYNALSRIGFSMGVGWVIFVCVIGQGDIVNSILSWKALIPLSRLTYCAYLVHPIVLTTYFCSIRELIDFKTTNMVMVFLGGLFLSYVAALVTSLLYESPVIRLERLLRNKLSKKNA